MKQVMFSFVAAIMVSGLLLGSMGNAVFADVANDNPGKAKGCDNANNDKVKDKNPHCDVTECPGIVFWYHDHDGDGYGSPDEKILSCIDGSELPAPPPGAEWVTNDDDCDDANPEVWNTC